MDGGAFGLLGLIALHRGAVEYDLSTRFAARCPRGLRSVGDTISLWELARLVRILRSDPSSAIAAAVEGWSHPVDRVSLLVMDLYDLTVAINSDPKKGRPTPHPGRPFEPAGSREVRKLGNAGGRSRAEVVEILNALGHNLPV